MRRSARQPHFAASPGASFNRFCSASRRSVNRADLFETTRLRHGGGARDNHVPQKRSPFFDRQPSSSNDRPGAATESSSSHLPLSASSGG